MWPLEREKREMTDQQKKPKAVIVGGSIAGVSCAHTLILAGWDVVVVEKSYAAPTGSPTGAGLGLDPLALKLIQSWIKEPELLNKATLPLTIDQVQTSINSQFNLVILQFYKFPSSEFYYYYLLLCRMMQ